MSLVCGACVLLLKKWLSSNEGGGEKSNGENGSWTEIWNLGDTPPHKKKMFYLDKILFFIKSDSQIYSFIFFSIN